MWWLLVGCAPGPFTQESAEAAFTALTSVNEDLFARVWAETDPLADLEDDTGDGGDTGGATPTPTPAKGMTWTPAEEGAAGAFDGTIEGPGSWTGTVTLTGTHGVADGGAVAFAYGWDMTATYDDVRFGDVRLDGTFGWTVLAAYDGGSAVQTSTVTGDLVGRGAAAGSGAVETVTRVSLSGGRYVVQVTGTVGGWDVARSYDATAYAL